MKTKHAEKIINVNKFNFLSYTIEIYEHFLARN